MSENKKTVKLKFYHKGIEFDNLKTLLKVYKSANLSLELVFSEYICLNSNEPKYLEAINEIKKMWNELDAYTPKDVFKKFTNQEQKMCLLSLFAPEDIAKSLNSEIVDSQTITKKQTRTILKDRKNQNNKNNINDLLIDDVSLKVFEYEDTYELHRSPNTILGTENDVYFVKCNDASTNKSYFLFVDPNSGADIKTDAIAAIASTMRKDNGEILTKKEYLELLQSET